MPLRHPPADLPDSARVLSSEICCVVQRTVFGTTGGYVVLHVKSQSEQNHVSDALTWLDEHGDALFAYAQARLGDEHTAEDLVQETLLAAMQSWETFRGEASVRTWLISILRRKVIDHYRHARRHKHDFRRLDSDILTDNRSGQTETEYRVMSEEFAVAFDRCLQKLPPATVQAFVLRVMDELDSQHVCRTLNISPTNLSVRLHRARMALKDCLERSLRREL